MIEPTDTLTKVGATASVGAAGASYTYLGLPLADLMGLATIVYLIAQILCTLAPLVADLRCWFKRRRV